MTHVSNRRAALGVSRPVLVQPLGWPLSALALSLAIAWPAQAAEPGAGAGGSRIERVTVYPGLALVERSAKVAAGTRELVLDCLSPNFDMASLQIDGADGVRLGPVATTTRPRAEVPACESTPLDGRIRSLEDRIAAVQAETGGHDLVLGYLRGLGPVEVAASSAAVAPVAPALVPAARSLPLPASAASLQALLGGVQRAGQEAYSQQNRLSREREALERELQPLLAERERLRGQSGEVRQLRISLAASREVSLKLRYQVPGPTWAPAYRATLVDASAAAPAVLVERLAQVSQRTGEDWAGVKLTLSTGSPRSATAGPEPRPWTVALRPPESRMRALAAPMAMAAAPVFKTAEVADAAVAQAEPEPDFSVQQVEGEFATEFDVPGAVDVGSGGQRVSLALGNQRLPAALRVQTVPQQDASAWLVAEVARPEGVWPQGPMQLLRGTQAVGQSVWRSGEQDKLSLPFGRDELVRVRVLPGQQKTGSTGFIGSRQERRVSYAYEVENRHRSAIELLVLEPSPVAQDEQISVTSQFNPAPQTGFWQDVPGVVAWRQSVAAGQKLRFLADYSISHPKDMLTQENR